LGVVTDNYRSKESAVCPESTIDSAPRRDFIRRAALTAAGVGVGATVLGKSVLPQTSASSLCCPSPCFINLNVENCERVDNNNNNSGLLLPGVFFGQRCIVCCCCYSICCPPNVYHPGAGIASPRACGAPNKNGLNLMTKCVPRITINNNGNIGLANFVPGSPLCVNGTIRASQNVSGFCNGQASGGLHGYSPQCYGVSGSSCTGIGVYSNTEGCGIGIVGLSDSPVIGKFKNTASSGDSSTLVQIENGNKTPASWNVGVAGCNNSFGIAKGDFYIQQVGVGARVAIDNCGVIYSDAACLNVGTLHPSSIAFGASGSGEGIASNRHTCRPNQYGLCFYTDATSSSVLPRMSITNSGNVGVGTRTPGTTLQVAGSVGTKLMSATTDYTMVATDFGVLADAGSGGLIVTLPPASTASGMIVFIKRIDSSTSSVSVNRSGSDTIEGATSQPLAKQYSGLTLVSDGSTNWYIIDSSS
jgi:hypothetical protein